MILRRHSMMAKVEIVAVFPPINADFFRSLFCVVVILHIIFKSGSGPNNRDRNVSVGRFRILPIVTCSAY